MSLPHAILGLLKYRRATGYELKNKFNQSIYFFWNATLPQIYRTLKEMLNKGWLTTTIEHQESKPNRKIYNLTDTGLEEFQRWLAESPEFPEHRNPMLIKIFFGKNIDPRQLRDHIQKYREHYASLLEQYNKESTAIIGQYASAANLANDVPYWNLARDYGLRHAKMVIEWCDAALASIDSRT
jgi:PadR family transcriptional regulator AphA